MQISRPATLILTYARSIFAVTFLLVAFEVGPSWIIDTDWFKIVNMALFALSNGWLNSLCVIKTPEYVPQEERGDIGALVNPVIVGGVLLGTALAIPMK